MTRIREATPNESVAEVSKRLEPYLGSPAEPWTPDAHDAAPVLDELSERAAMLVAVMPPGQHRETIERLVCAHDPERGRQAVDALVESARITEDDRGRLRLP